MPNLTVFTNGKKANGDSTKKVKLTNKGTGGPPDIDHIKQIEINYLWITTSGPNAPVSGKYITFTGPGSTGLTAVIMGSGLFGANLVVWFYVYPAIHLEEKDPDRILGLLGDLVVTVDTSTGTQETGTDTGISEP
jgi:hypothetical protein